ncbi:MAG TPA: acyl-CoA thioesterase, partial [Selenomonas sp.]|nr:acyl-CoA thioesterase [Selenomonas sp.]
TARVDELEFHKPIFIGDLVTCTAKVVFVGHTSMEVFVNVEVQDMEREDKPERALTAYFTMVALDRNGRPHAVQPLEVITEEEKEAFAAGRKRYEDHKAAKRAAYAKASTTQKAQVSAKK